MLDAVTRDRGAVGPDRRIVTAPWAAAVVAGVVAGAGASAIFFYAAHIVDLSTGVRSLDVASATVGSSVVFSTALVLAAWSFFG